MSADLLDLSARIGPIIVFLLAITITAEIAERAGVFDVAGHAMAKWGRHRIWLLWLLFSTLAVLCTVALSLDTTAVLLTPVGLAIARQIGVPPLPFALTTLWIANTGSLLLPVSNLTNLLALHRLSEVGVDHLGYLRLAFWPAVAAIVATLLAVAILRWRDLRGRFRIEPPAAPHDRGMLLIAGAVCVIVGPLFAIGLSPAWVSSVAAAILLIAAAIRAPQMIKGLSIPWQMAIGFAAISVVVTIAGEHGLTELLARAAGSGDSTAGLFQLAGASAVAANVVNNLPAYLALEPVATSAHALFAILIGVNAGPLVTPWASLATLLWLQRCRAGGVRLPAGKLAAAGLACSVAAVGAATAALAFL